MLTTLLKLVGLGQWGAIISAALALKANRNAVTEAALLDAADQLGDAEDTTLAPVFDAVAAVGHDAINFLNGTRTPALEIQAAKDGVAVINTLIPAGKQVPAADLANLENAILVVISDEGVPGVESTPTA